MSEPDDWRIEFAEISESDSMNCSDGAGDEIRTRDSLLGRQELYH